MNAYEMYQELLKTEVCDGLDEWIKTKLFERMRAGGNMTAFFATNALEWPSVSFMHAMRELGYTINVECDDRPAAQPFYKISIDITVPGR